MKACRLVYLVTVPLSIFLGILATVHGNDDPRTSGSCTNEKSIDAAIGQRVSSQGNLFMHPCDNFYAHACFGSQPLSTDHTIVKIEHDILQSFKDLKGNDTTVFHKSKKFHDACTKHVTHEKKVLSAIKKILSHNGKWPVTVTSNKSINRKLSWKEIHENFASHTGISALFDVTVLIDHNSGGHILSLGVPTVPSKSAHFMSQTKRETRREDYRKYVLETLQKFTKISKFDIRADVLRANVEGIIAVEDKLAEIAILDDNETDNVDDSQITTIEKLQQDWDNAILRHSDHSINWLKTISDRFEGTGIAIDASQKITLRPGAFVANLTHVLVNASHRMIVNYIDWKIIDNLMPYVRSGLHNPDGRKTTGATFTTRFCIKNNVASHALAYMWVKRLLTVKEKEAALKIVISIQEEMAREIEESSWLDDDTKSVIEEKINATINIIGYPDWYDVPGKIDEYYRELEVGDDHLENVLAYNRFKVKKKLSHLRSLVDKSEIEWSPSPYHSGTEHLRPWNAFTIDPVLLKPPFFKYNHPTVLNYAGFGNVVGRGFTNVFDDAGRRFDKAGRKGKWWSQSAIDTYETKAQCFVKQYNKYTVVKKNGDIVHLNGEKTKSMNIADTIGFRASLRAYQILRNNGKTNIVKIQPLGNFSDKKFYFHELAHMFCTSEETHAEDIVSYSPPQLRINGALSNMQEFADEFHCPPGSPMNPSEKCLIWD